jgi:hypothetical protein
VEFPTHAVLCGPARGHVFRVGHQKHDFGGPSINVDDHIVDCDNHCDSAGWRCQFHVELVENSVSFFPIFVVSICVYLRFAFFSVGVDDETEVLTYQGVRSVSIFESFVLMMFHSL